MRRGLALTLISPPLTLPVRPELRLQQTRPPAGNLFGKHSHAGDARGREAGREGRRGGAARAAHPETGWRRRHGGATAAASGSRLGPATREQAPTQIPTGASGRRDPRALLAAGKTAAAGPDWDAPGRAGLGRPGGTTALPRHGDTQSWGEGEKEKEGEGDAHHPEGPPPPQTPPSWDGAPPSRAPPPAAKLRPSGAPLPPSHGFLRECEKAVLCYPGQMLSSPEPRPPSPPPPAKPEGRPGTRSRKAPSRPPLPAEMERGRRHRNSESQCHVTNSQARSQNQSRKRARPHPTGAQERAELPGTRSLRIQSCPVGPGRVNAPPSHRKAFRRWPTGGSFPP
ncbi:basic salivary proline-rich protein 3-like [Petaurus breviceps papuanus]|uniref:basic salivary proline-rich protein 3-like n=1 Tax=Petaurus breviceps papuanus TaxID=3040969 RepID=UPI0036DB57FA